MDKHKADKQDLCISEAPSPCEAKCPIHVDVLSMLNEIEQGNFNKAYKILAKRMPFPRILCRICDHVCEKECLRESAGGCISIGQLEKAAVKYGFSDFAARFAIPKNGKKVAVVGGGISGLTAAFYLYKKGYNVTIYEKENRIGGRIWNFPREVLDESIIEEELKSIYESDIEIKLNTELNERQIESLVNEYDAVYAGIGRYINKKVDKDTFETETKGLFAGGIAANNSNSVIFSVSSGKRAAISIDRYIQKKSMKAARENEGAYDTPLKLNMDDIPPVSKFYGSDKDEFTKEEAQKEASRCIKCKCAECVKGCPHLRRYNTDPKQYIKKINLNEAIILGDHYANKMINSCTLCGLCGESCPNKLNMKDVILETRRSMVDRGKMPPSAHDFAIKDMEFSNSEKFALVKNQPNFDKSKFLFFPGCQLSASSPQYVEKSYNYLMSHIDEGVGIMLGCCGAPAEWAGRKKMFEDNMENIKAKWNSIGKPTLILACSTCASMFETYAPEIKFVSLWEVMVKKGIPQEGKNSKKMIFTIHDSCTARYNKNIQDSARAIITGLGHEIEELKYTREKTKCCGYGGLVYYANKEQAEDFIKDRINESDKDFVVYCSMCRDLFASQGKRTLHLLDLIFGDDLEKLAEKRGTRLWERRYNRSSLKAKILKMYGEDMNDKKTGLDIVLSDEIKDLMGKRWILLQDVEQVIEYAENTGRKFINPQNGHYLAKKVLSNVTYWVEYEKKEDKYIVHNTYSHRMEVMEE